MVKPAQNVQDRFRAPFGPIDRTEFVVLVIGAGFAGSVMAERLHASGYKVLVCDRRPLIGGNAFDELDEHDVLVHRYGAHVFHTTAKRVVDYLSQFTGWRDYRHRVMARVGDKLVPMPVNRTTVNLLFGLSLRTDAECQEWFDAHRHPLKHATNSEEAVIDKVGHELFELLFRGYTRKQWDREPSELDKSVCARLPVRTNDDSYYFSDWF